MSGKAHGRQDISVAFFPLCGGSALMFGLKLTMSESRVLFSSQKQSRFPPSIVSTKGSHFRGTHVPGAFVGRPEPGKDFAPRLALT